MTHLALLLPGAVLATATLSGVFGMGGGLLLMGVYAAVLPVPAAMVLHGVTQVASNGSRCVLLRRHVHWPTVRRYLVGSVPAAALVMALGVVLDKTTLFIALGALPLVVSLVPPRPLLSVATRSGAGLCGAVVTAAMLSAGVSGPLLDLFFVTSPLDRFQVIGTKAITQTWGHLLKLVYFGALLTLAPGAALPTWAVPIVVVCAVTGTTLGRALLRRLDDGRFRRYSTALVRGIAVLLLARGLVGALTG